jgi:hypothetical protein
MPVSPSSRTGAMVTWIVVTAIVSVTCAVLAIYFYVDANKARDEAETLNKQYKEVVVPAALKGDDVNKLIERRNAPDAAALGYNPGMTALDVALKERDDLARKISSTATAETALSSADETIKASAEKAKKASVASLPQDLNGAVNTLTQALVARQGEVASLNDQLKQAQATATQAAEQMQANQAKLNEALAAARTETTQAGATLASDRASKDEQIKKMIADGEAAQKASQEQLAQAQASISELTKKNDDLTKRLNNATEKLGTRRANTAESVVRQADGHVIRIASNGTVYIDLGTGDQVSSGMTFEVYDRIEGVPPIGDINADENLPKGKASIEIVRVGPGSSECHVVMYQPGQQMREGDIIANLVYDRNTKYNFYIYGDYDLDQNGVATPQDAEIVKSLVTRWGGKLIDKINADTDFVVLGKEPVVLVPSKDDANDPIIQAKAQASLAAAEAYQRVKEQAIEYHIPILNQNRFLYFVGYYEAAQR